MTVRDYPFPAYGDPEILSDGWSGNLCPLCGYPMDRTETARTPVGKRGPPASLAPEDGTKPLLHDVCWRHVAAEALPESIGTTDDMGRLETFVYRHDGDEYLLKSSMGGARIMLLRGRCSATVHTSATESHRCSNNARYRWVGMDGFTDYCGQHTDEDDEGESPPELDLYGMGRVDLTSTCQQYVQRESGGGTAFEGHDDFDAKEAWGGAESGPCDDRAFLAIQPPDGKARTFCQLHARNVWIDQLRVRPHDPTLLEGRYDVE